MKIPKELEKYLIALYQDYYKFEMERKDRLSQLANFPLTVIIALFGFLAYIIRDLPNFSTEPLNIIVFTSFSASAVVLVISCTYLILGVRGKRYDYLTTPAKIEGHLKSLIEFNKNRKRNKINLTSEVFETLRENFSKAVDLNHESNGKKSDQIRRSIVLAGYAFIFSLLTVMIFTASKFNKVPEPYNIKNQNNERIKMSDNNKKPPASTKPTNSNEQKPIRPTNTTRVDNAKDSVKKPGT